MIFNRLSLLILRITNKLKMFKFVRILFIVRLLIFSIEAIAFKDILFE